MKINVSEATGISLDYLVAKCFGNEKRVYVGADEKLCFQSRHWNPSSDPAQGGLIIEQNDISVIRIRNKNIPDSKGFWCGKSEPQWAAVAGEQHETENLYGSQGDDWGKSYTVSEDAIIGPTQLIAAMRCFVISKIGNEVEMPDCFKWLFAKSG